MLRYSSRVTDNSDLVIFVGEPSLANIRTASLTPGDTASEKSWLQILEWMSFCTKHHEKCNELEVGFIPSRLIDVNYAKDKVRLEEIPANNSLPPTSTFPEYVTGSPARERAYDHRYACLSHCWGESRSPLLTRRDNLGKNIRGISIDQLPKSFQDAVYITRRLGLSYLWIDSFCIIQDDEEDWREQSALMVHIYKSAYVTIGAANAHDDDQGIFSTSSKRHKLAHRMEIADNERKLAVYFRRMLEHPDSNWPLVSPMPLMRRAWVLQEQLLSRRFLYFGTDELLWECLEDVACECSSTGTPFKLLSDGEEAAFYYCAPIKRRFTNLHERTSAECAEDWRTMVNAYTQRSLTLARDTLPALSGLAKAFKVCH